MIDPAYLERIGVFQDTDGSYKRHRIRTRNLEYDPTDPQAFIKGKLVGYDEELVPYPVILPLATDPDSIETARRLAASKGADFYHPIWGWLRWGIKPEKDHAENLGAGSVQYPRRHVVVGASQDDSAPVENPEPVATVPPALTKGGK